MIGQPLSLFLMLYKSHHENSSFSQIPEKNHYTLLNTTSTKLIFFCFHFISHSPPTLRRLLLFHNPVFFKVSVVSCFSVYIFSAPENDCLLKFLMMMLGRQHFSKTTLSYHFFFTFTTILMISFYGSFRQQL